MSTPAKPYVAKLVGAPEALMPGGAKRFCIGHESLPLLTQLERRHGAKIDIRCQQRGPAIVIDFVKQTA